MDVSRSNDIATRLALSIEQSANSDGGWGYYPAKSSRLEPTCWAALALSAHETASTPVRIGGLLAGWQREDGLLAESGNPTNVAFNGLAALALRVLTGTADQPRLDAVARRLVSGLCRTRGSRIADQPSLRQNNQLQAWPWTEGAFSWVEPTAWVLMALKRRAQSAQDPEVNGRVAVGEALLLDRACRGGGWNYGNSGVLGKDLRAYVPTTALALLALQDRREHAAVRAALSYLQANWHREPSGMALALTAICMRVYGLPTEAMEVALLDAWRRSGFLQNLSVMSMACYALGGEAHGNSAFQL
jgi:hypothetical protein